jgi:AraC family transcriptional regulator, transcriptional activator of pobA
LKFRLHQDQYIENPLYHFSFLKDIKVYGIYYNSLNRYLTRYPFIKTNHFHDFYSVILFTGGTGIIRICNKDYNIQPQTVCLIAPDQMHSFEDFKDVEGVIFFFCQDFYVEEFSFIRLLNIFSYTSQMNGNICNPCIPLSDKEFSPISNTIDSIQGEYEMCNPGNNSPLIIRSQLNILLLKISELYEKKAGKSNKGDSILIHKLSQLVDSYFIKEHHISFYTSAFNISEKHLNDICNRYFNCGLKKILQDRLMQEARKLLMSSEMSVAEIAYKLNFEDNSYFNRVFRKKANITPKRFREMHRKILP